MNTYLVVAWDGDDMVHEEETLSYEDALEIGQHMSENFDVEIITPDGDILTV